MALQPIAAGRYDRSRQRLGQARTIASRPCSRQTDAIASSPRVRPHLPGGFGRSVSPWRWATLRPRSGNASTKGALRHPALDSCVAKRTNKEHGDAKIPAETVSQPEPRRAARHCFFAPLGGDRRHPAPFFRTEEVPAFDGDLAWFLAERAPRRG